MDDKQIVVAFKASPAVVARIDAVARAECNTRAGVVKRLTLREFDPKSLEGDAA